MTELLTRLFVGRNPDPKDPGVRHKFGSLSSFVGIAVNLLLSAMKLIIGVLSASVAITADALNNLSDAGSSVVTLVSFRIAAKPADRDHPFGHARIEYIASMIVSFLILLVGAELFKESAATVISAIRGEEIATPDFSVVTIVILSLSIISKLWLSIFYRKIGKKIDSQVIRASAADSLSDSLSTLAVLVSTIIIKLTGFVILDAIVGLAVAALIVIAGIKILNETKNSLLGEAPVEETVKDIKEIVSHYPEILGIHDMLVHNYGPNHYIASFHAEVDGNEDVFYLHDCIDNAEHEITTKLGILCTIHLDPIETRDERTKELRELAERAAKNVEETLSIHDFRTVIGTTHTNLIFDVVLPFESKFTPETVKEAITEKVSEERPDCFCVITVDRG